MSNDLHDEFASRRPHNPGPPHDPGRASGTGDFDTQTDIEVETDVRFDRLWNVIVWNDPINLMSYVTYVFQKLFGHSLEKATKHMLEVHNEGRSVVETCERERGELYVGKLHDFGLQATLEKQS